MSAPAPVDGGSTFCAPQIIHDQRREAKAMLGMDEESKELLDEGGKLYVPAAE